jgi:hypothetical protein
LSVHVFQVSYFIWILKISFDISEGFEVNYYCLIEKVKGKVLSALAMKAYRGSGVIFPLILNIGAKWRRVVSFILWLFYLLGKNLQYLLHWRMGGPHS